jgi:amino acid transporter
VFLGFVNSLNVKIVSKMQTLFTITKVITFIIVICVGIWTSIDTSTQIKETLVEWLPEEKSFDHSKIALAFYNALFAYSGW